MTQEFVMDSSLYRQEQELSRAGMQRMSNWVLHFSTGWLKPVYARLHEELPSGAAGFMAQRTVEAVEMKTLPLNTTGHSLLSGNVFYAHCGGRLILTTNGSVRINASSKRINRKRI